MPKGSILDVHNSQISPAPRNAASPTWGSVNMQNSAIARRHSGDSNAQAARHCTVILRSVGVMVRDTCLFSVLCGEPGSPRVSLV